MTPAAASPWSPRRSATSPIAPPRRPPTSRPSSRRCRKSRPEAVSASTEGLRIADESSAHGGDRRGGAEEDPDGRVRDGLPGRRRSPGPPTSSGRPGKAVVTAIAATAEQARQIAVGTGEQAIAAADDRPGDRRDAEDRAGSHQGGRRAGAGRARHPQGGAGDDASWRCRSARRPASRRAAPSRSRRPPNRCAAAR